MRWYDYFIRFFVGIFFIFSGLTKLDDPVGTAIKLKEYFEVFSTSISGIFTFFIPFDLTIAVIIIVLEVMLGIALLFNYRVSVIAWVYLFLTSFFTFLTFYSAYFNKVTDCGCFGDAIPLTSWESFYKDVFLLALVIILFIRRRYFNPNKLNSKILEFVIYGFLLINIFIAVYTIRHLPFIDFRPYKIGNNIPTLMKPSEPFRYQYIMEKDGREYKLDQYPADTTFKFKKMVLLNPGAQPKITDYHVWNDDGDFTQESFKGNKLFIIMYDVGKANTGHFDEINSLVNSLNGQAETWILSASDKHEIENILNKYHLNIQYYYTDMTVLEAIVRSNPGLWLLQNGTVKGKWPFSNLPDSKEISSLLN